MNILARLAVIVFADPLKSLLEFRDPPPSLIKTKKRKGAHLWTTMGDHITVFIPYPQPSCHVLDLRQGYGLIRQLCSKQTITNPRERVTKERCQPFISWSPN